MTDNQHILHLIDRFEKRLATESELAELDAWYTRMIEMRSIPQG